MGAYIHEFVWKINSPVKTVFEALTTPDALSQWFAEHVESDHRVDGSFRFWGKHTIETPTGKQANQRIRIYEPPTRFGYTWQLLGEDSTVVYWLKSGSTKDQTRCEGKHTFTEKPSGDRVSELIDDLWRLNNGNLVAYLDGGAGICLPDYADAHPEIRQSILIDAPRKAVFSALINPEILAQWIGGKDSSVDPKVGGKYSYGWNYKVNGKNVSGGPTKILEIVENEKLITDWPDWRGDTSVPNQTITWLLADEGKSTRVTLIHSGFTRAVDISDFPFGWGDFLGALRSTIENQT